MKLENASIFNRESYDCGTDTEKAAYLFSEFVRKVWQYEGEINFERWRLKCKYGLTLMAVLFSENEEIGVCWNGRGVLGASAVDFVVFGVDVDIFINQLKTSLFSYSENLI